MSKAHFLSISGPKKMGSLALECVRQHLNQVRVLPIGYSKPQVETSSIIDRERQFSRLFASAITLRVDRFPKDSWVSEVSNDIAETQLGRKIKHVSLFLSPKGGATPPHYDADDVAVCQLRGAKVVHIANTPSVDDPKADKLLNDLGTGSIEVFQLSRGTAVFVPRGYAHSTASHESSITLGIGLT